MKRKKKQLILLEVFGVAFAIIIIVTASSPLFPAGININTPENFPDENFRWAAERLMGVIPNGHFTAEQAAIQTGELNFLGMKVKSVKGLEYFKSITSLNATKNHLTSLDLSNQSLLKDLRCSDNLLKSLDISHCQNLIFINCNKNLLHQLDVSNCPELYTLHCHSNKLESLNLSNNTNLDTVHCANNDIATLTIGKIPNLRILNCYDNRIQELDISHLKSLNVIQIRNNPLTVFPKSNSNVFVNIDITESDIKQ